MKYDVWSWNVVMWWLCENCVHRKTLNPSSDMELIADFIPLCLDHRVYSIRNEQFYELCRKCKKRIQFSKFLWKLKTETAKTLTHTHTHKRHASRASILYYTESAYMWLWNVSNNREGKSVNEYSMRLNTNDSLPNKQWHDGRLFYVLT